MHVGAADADGLDADHDLPRTGDGIGHLVDGEPAGFVEDDGSHRDRAPLRAGSAPAARTVQLTASPPSSTAGPRLRCCPAEVNAPHQGGGTGTAGHGEG
ncbi:hypothetical protein GCM10009616_10510 [Microlunatus lacustris]